MTTTKHSMTPQKAKRVKLSAVKNSIKRSFYVKKGTIRKHLITLNRL